MKTNAPVLSIFLALVVLASAGCSTLKSPSQSDHIWTPPKWEKTTKKPDEVWMELRKRKTGSSGNVKLIELINIALRNNPEMLRTYYDARSAHAALKQAESAWYPKITASGDFTKDRRNTNLRSDEKNTRSYEGGIDATMLAFDFGGRAAAVKEAYHALIAANYNYNQAIQDVILDTEDAYFTLYGAKANVEAAQASVQDADTTLYVTKQKHDAGVAVRLDVLQSEANYDETLYDLEEAKGELKSAEADLAVVLGFPADTQIKIEDPLWDVPENVTEQDVKKLIEEGLKNRPDIASARAIFRSKKSAVYAANSELWPTISVEGTVTKNWTQFFGANKSYKHYQGYTGALKASWDIFDGFNNYAAVKEAAADRDSERTQLMQDELDASADIWKNFYDLKTAITKLNYSEAFLDTAQKSFDLSVESYRAGLKSVLDMIHAHNQLAEARSDLVQSKNDMYINFVELLHSTGSLTVESVSEERGG